MTNSHQERKKFSWITELFRLGTCMVQGDLEDVRRQILDHAVTGFGATSGSLSLTNSDKTSLTLVAGIGLPAHVVGRQIPYGKEIVGTVAAEGKPVLLQGDISGTARYAGLIECRERRRPSSSICWPLRINNQIIGVMSLNRTVDMQPFTEDDIDQGEPIINLMALVIDNIRLYTGQQKHIHDLFCLNADLIKSKERLEAAQTQLLQSEKMASIGLLAAGVAHEINNPVGYINSNLSTLQGYIKALMRLIDCYTRAESLLPAESKESLAIRKLKEEIDLDYLQDDIGNLLRESQEGVVRVRGIVQDLKEFSHVDKAEWEMADLHRGLESTLNIVHNEIKYKAEVIKEFDDLPLAECIPSQINQVFMNLLVNAAQAIEGQGRITLRSRIVGQEIWIDVEDTGRGIAPKNLDRIFDPFFTTKPVGKGTGLGLSLSWNIVQRHHGRLKVHSTEGVGTTFTLILPIRRSKQQENAA
jgi:two-component system, NtrC family, sensor kinase